MGSLLHVCEALAMFQKTVSRNGVVSLYLCRKDLTINEISAVVSKVAGRWFNGEF